MNQPLVLREIQLPALPAGREWVPVSHGESGDQVFQRSDRAAYAKISKGKGVTLLDEERQRTQWLSSFDLGSPTVLDWVVSGDGACLVTSPVPGMPASELSAKQLGRAWPSIAERVKLLHAIPAGLCPFERGLSTMLGRAEGVVARNAVNPDFLSPEDQHIPPTALLAALQGQAHERLEQEIHDLVVCHGDACMPNFMIDPDTLSCTGLIDLGRLGTADRYVDFALMLANAKETWSGPDEAKAAFKNLFDIHAISSPDEERLEFYLRLDPLTWG
ncbi:MAG: APH(3'') family aminoglycoside O-phosphotransferase [Phyllobacterium sp.]